ncbi:MAG: FtsW/RodA/SpoVE family cell cycle protein [Bacillus sp. (in: firmicutes)]
MDKRQTFSERFDWTLCLLLFLFLIVSVVSIYNAQTGGQHLINFAIKQVIYYATGVVIIGVVMYFDPEQIKRLSWYLYGIGILLLVLLMLAPDGEGQIGRPINGAKSWFSLPGFSFQPSEFMKVFLILALAKITVQHNSNTIHKTIQTDLMLFLKLSALTALPFLLVLKQPDLGTGLVVLSIFLGITLVSGITWKLLIPILSSAGLVAGTIFFLVLYAPELLSKYLGVDPYQFDRIYTWLNPEEYSGAESFQLEQSLSAIGSGMMSGKLFSGSAVYIPEKHSDFIFSVIGEEFGFIGSSIVVGLFFLLIFHITKIALSKSDPFISYVCAGIISMITFHVFQNIGMTIQVLPITGIPLPFISYGGSSLWGNMLAMGILFSFQYHHRAFMFSNNAHHHSLSQ